jgi:hypothetical protein
MTENKPPRKATPGDIETEVLTKSRRRAGIAGDLDGPLFRTTAGPCDRRPAATCPVVGRSCGRAAAVGLKTRTGNHAFRATGITAYLKNDRTLEHAQTMANHSSPRTT